MTLDQICAGVASYIEQEIAAPAPTGAQKFLYYASIPFVDKTIRQMAEQYRPLAESIGIVDEKGEWDLSMLRTSALEAIKKSGPFQAAGIIVRAEDIEKLWSYLN